MKKRIRKKQHLGEFAQYGILMTFDVTEDEIDKVIDCVNDFADAHGLYSWGGGFGRLSVQDVKGSYEIPETVAGMMLGLIGGECGKLVFCLYSPDRLRVPDDVREELASVFAAASYKMKDGPKEINLWHP